jgi:hypothetical protein
MAPVSTGACEVLDKLVAVRSNSSTLPDEILDEGNDTARTLNRIAAGQRARAVTNRVTPAGG